MSGPARIIFNGANLIDGKNPPQAGTTVVVEGSRIASVGAAPAAASDGDRVIDLAGRALLPGMFSCHFHTGFGLFGAGTSAPFLGLEAPPALMGMLAAKNARTALECGLTGIIGSSNPDNLDVCLKEAILQDLTPGPRMLACTREFMVSGDQADGENRNWFMGVANHGLVRRLDGADAFRQATREELGRGCDVVKLSVAPGHGSAATRDLCYLSRAELEAVVETAHERGKLVRAHCPSRKAILECARAGVDIIDHADRVDAECIDAILEAGSTVCPSMLWSTRFLAMAESWDHSLQPFPIGEGFPETLDETLARLRGVREEFEYTKKMLPELHKSGVHLVTGDDFGTPVMPHGDYVSELEVYVNEVGIPAADVIGWATVNGARLMGRGDELGSVEVGKLADLVVVDGNPLEEIGALRNVAAVLKDGDFAVDRLGA
jgi:imidazolonepropionase-like amidohydrolase